MTHRSDQSSDPPPESGISVRNPTYLQGLIDEDKRKDRMIIDLQGEVDARDRYLMTKDVRNAQLEQQLRETQEESRQTRESVRTLKEEVNEMAEAVQDRDRKIEDLKNEHLQAKKKAENQLAAAKMRSKEFVIILKAFLTKCSQIELSSEECQTESDKASAGKDEQNGRRLENQDRRPVKRTADINTNGIDGNRSTDVEPSPRSIKRIRTGEKQEGSSKEEIVVRQPEEQSNANSSQQRILRQRSGSAIPANRE